ncbi:uncharacterized protein LOC142570769 [Dermacentor variabilis]|uniref:uncharacterized protein LOC142570769 n=1 Tax=Dermacentor variabilis TaxID=34621 RepID=UPI003F5BFD50
MASLLWCGDVVCVQPATGGGKVGGVDGRVLDVLMRTGGVLVPPLPSFSPIARTQVQRKLQGPAVPADIHQRQLPSWCRALQLLLGQVALHSHRLSSRCRGLLPRCPSRPPRCRSLPLESHGHPVDSAGSRNSKVPW